MGSNNPEELGLELKLCAARAAEVLLEVIPSIADGEARAERLEELMKDLLEERSKIEAFKRVLPLSFRILSHVIEILKEKLEQCNKSKFEEVKRVELDCNRKMDWLISSKLWNPNRGDNTVNNNNNHSSKKEMKEEGDNTFLPSKGPSCLTACPIKEAKPSPFFPDLSLWSCRVNDSRPIPLMADEHHYSTITGLSSKGVGTQQQLPRKPRRCWSPNLHCMFVKALHQLGGAQVATPKQIREFMNVEGLTNDEVKSHLQKYRMYIQRKTNSAPSSVMVVPQDRCASHSKSPEGTLQLTYSSRAISVNSGDSGDEDGKSESYSCDEDGKSESYSCK